MEEIDYRAVAESDGKSRTKTLKYPERLLPTKRGDWHPFGDQIGETQVTGVSVGNDGVRVVMTTVTTETFAGLTMINGWSAVE